MRQNCVPDRTWEKRKPDQTNSGITGTCACREEEKSKGFRPAPKDVGKTGRNKGQAGAPSQKGGGSLPGRREFFGEEQAYRNF